MDKHLDFIGVNEHSLESIGKQLLHFAKDIKVWILHGQLGVGKTTLIKAIANVLEVRGNMSSPTFSIVNEYITSNGETIYHIDLYRLKHIEEAIQIGIEDYLFSDNYCFIEWPELIEDILPAAHLVLNLEVQNNSERTIKASIYE